MPFVSPSYVEIYGMPKNSDDIRQKIIELSFRMREQTRGKEMYDKYAGREQLGFVAMRNNVSTRPSLVDRQGCRHRLACRPMCRRLATR